MKKIFRYLVASIFIGLTFAVVSPVVAKAGVYLDGNNNFCIDTGDKKRTSSIWYRTDQFVVTRCRYNPPEKYPHSADDYIYYRGNIRDFYKESEIGGMMFNTFTVPIDWVISNASAEWAEEIQKALDGTGPGVWIKFDSVMYVFHDSYSTTMPYSGPYYNAGISYWPNPAQIQAAEGWRDPRGLATHFNRYFYIGKGEPKEPIKLNNTVEDGQLDHRETLPKYTTGNHSDEYDLGQGIPGGKNVTNDSTASRWCGKTDFRVRTNTTDKYSNVKYEIHIRWWTGEYETERHQESICILPTVKDTGVINT